MAPPLHLSSPLRLSPCRESMLKQFSACVQEDKVQWEHMYDSEPLSLSLLSTQRMTKHLTPYDLSLSALNPPKQKQLGCHLLNSHGGYLGLKFHAHALYSAII